MIYRKAKRVKIVKKSELFLIGFQWEGEAPAPGQFFMLSLEETFLPRPFSVYDYKDGILYFLVKSVGRFTDILPEAKNINILGPLGNPAPIFEKCIFIGGGIGTAPLHFHAKLTKNFTFIAGAKGKELVPFLEDLEDKGKMIYVSEDGTTGIKGIATDPLNGRKIEEKVIACGPLPMLKRVKEKAPAENTFLYMEQFMACGYGSCKGCAIMTRNGYKLVCRDGPVFPAEEVILD